MGVIRWYCLQLRSIWHRKSYKIETNRRQINQCFQKDQSYPLCSWTTLCGGYLYSMVLCGIVSNGLQERLSVVTEGYSLGIKFGLVGSCCAQGAAVVFILLFVVVVMDLAGLQTPRKDRRLEPLCRNNTKLLLKHNQDKMSLADKYLHIEARERAHSGPTGTFNLHGGQGGALGQVGGMEAQKQPQVSFSVNQWRRETAEVWSSDCLLVWL